MCVKLRKSDVLGEYISLLVIYTQIMWGSFQYFAFYSVYILLGVVYNWQKILGPYKRTVKITTSFWRKEWD